MRTLAAILTAAALWAALAQTPAGKVAPKPLYRDPPFDAPTDPVLCYNAELKKWLMYYTARRANVEDAPGVRLEHRDRGVG